MRFVICFGFIFFFCFIIYICIRSYEEKILELTNDEFFPYRRSLRNLLVNLSRDLSNMIYLVIINQAFMDLAKAPAVFPISVSQTLSPPHRYCAVIKYAISSNQSRPFECVLLTPTSVHMIPAKKQYIRSIYVL